VRALHKWFIFIHNFPPMFLNFFLSSVAVSELPWVFRRTSFFGSYGGVLPAELPQIFQHGQHPHVVFWRILPRFPLTSDISLNTPVPRRVPRSFSLGHHFQLAFPFRSIIPSPIKNPTKSFPSHSRLSQWLLLINPLATLTNDPRHCAPSTKPPRLLFHLS